MTIFDDARAYIDTVDPSAEHVEQGFGFDPDVCEGCPHRMDDVRGMPCDLCGCPTVSGLLLDMTGAPPADCIRLDQHEGR